MHDQLWLPYLEDLSLDFPVCRNYMGCEVSVIRLTQRRKMHAVQRFHQVIAYITKQRKYSVSFNSMKGNDGEPHLHFPCFVCVCLEQLYYFCPRVRPSRGWNYTSESEILHVDQVWEKFSEGFHRNFFPLTHESYLLIYDAYQTQHPFSVGLKLIHSVQNHFIC